MYRSTNNALIIQYGSETIIYNLLPRTISIPYLTIQTHHDLTTKTVL